mmetsp:Transcript_8136/g.50367  ORF Transcript_8136/g.50367 Transcript_8136/m.50367 type:complete len:202 (+) Transcript_8136:3811-4416(+)
MRRIPRITSFILRFCLHMARLSCRPDFWKVSAWNLKFSVLSTKSSIFSPRSRTRSIFSIMTLFTAETWFWTLLILSGSADALIASFMNCLSLGAYCRSKASAMAVLARNPYVALKSSLMRSSSTKGICLPTAASATTRYAAHRNTWVEASGHRLAIPCWDSFQVFASVLWDSRSICSFPTRPLHAVFRLVVKRLRSRRARN